MFTILKEQLSSVIKEIVASILIKIISFALDMYDSSLAVVPAVQEYFERTCGSVSFHLIVIPTASV